MSDSSGMPSTRASILVRKSISESAIGAIVKPQLPPTTLVTPCRGDGVHAGSHSTCAS